MPRSFGEFAGRASAAPAARRPFGATPAAPVEDDSSALLPLLLGAAGLGVLGVASRNPSLVGKAASKLGDIRQQSMLSGFALPKSVLGNVGAATIASAERKSMAPLKELFSRQTLNDARAAWKAGTPASVGGPSLTVFGKELPSPGRAMGALDEATQAALQRAGLTADEATSAVLQKPLGGQLGEALNKPAAKYLIPFRRTPFNQFFEGLKTASEHPISTLVTKGNLGPQPLLHAANTAAGMGIGYATADEKYPVELGFSTAFAGRYGVPHVLAAILGRELGGGRADAALGQQILPVSEYSIESGIRDPLQPYYSPAALRALRQLTGEQ